LLRVLAQTRRQASWEAAKANRTAALRLEPSSDTRHWSRAWCNLEPTQTMSGTRLFHAFALTSGSYSPRNNSSLRRQVTHTKKGQGAEAKRLSRTAHQTDEKYRRARQEASVTILHLRNHGKPADTLDLHGQYVEEALSFTKQRLKELRNINNAQRTSSLLIITGAGHHSEDGRAKIRPAVLNFLRKKGYSFKEEGPGAFRVHLGAESTEGCFASLLRMLGLKK
jgi:DNA-nicking Smr family endonuclease